MRPAPPRRTAAAKPQAFALFTTLALFATLALLATMTLWTANALAEGPDYRAPVQPPSKAEGGKAGGGKAEEAAPRFPNKDTAKNRQDYEMSTSSGEAIIMGKDAQTGEDIVLRMPKKKTTPEQGVNQPLEVRPIVPLIWK